MKALNLKMLGPLAPIIVGRPHHSGESWRDIKTSDFKYNQYPKKSLDMSLISKFGAIQLLKNCA